MGTIVSLDTLLRVYPRRDTDLGQDSDCRKPFSELSGCLLANACNIHGDVTLAVSEPTDSDFPPWLQHESSAESFLKVECQIEVFSREDEADDDLVDLFGLDEPESKVARAAEFGFLEAVNNLVLCAIIAAPGAFSVGGLITDERRFDLKFSAAYLLDVLETAEVLQWPPLVRLNASMVRDWMFRLPGFLQGRGSGQAGRALAAFSHLLEAGSHSGPIFLIWAMVGLEALYTRNESEVQKQILHNSELLLGPRLANTKTFKQMYDFRSKFLHGAKDLPFAHLQPDGETWEMYWLDMSQHGCVATAMLVASLQQLILRNWTSFDFASVIVGQAERI